MLRRVGLGGSAVLAMVIGAACGSNGSSNSAQGDDGGGDATSSGGDGSSGSGGSSGGGSGGSSGSASSSGSSSGASGSSSGAGSSSGTKGDSGADSGPPPFDPSVYQHHRNGTRDGLYIDSVFTQAAATTTHVLSSFMGTVTTKVYAQPLYVENGPGGEETFIVATEDNHLTAYKATDGTQLWDTGPSTIGPVANDSAPGGTVGSGQFGITGTPYIDIATRTIFFDAMTTPDNNASYHHKVFAVSLDTGMPEANWPVDVDSVLSGFDSGVENQRGALQFVNGILYVPYGGYDGDQGAYHGMVVGFPVANPQQPKSWATTAAKGGIWGPGALPTDGTSIFPITGNAPGGTKNWGGQEAVVRLAAGPTFSGNAADYFAPSDWSSLDGADKDLGGASEVLVDMPGAQHPHLVLATGKDGKLYVLNRDNLGGIGGELLQVQVSPAGNSPPGSATELKGAPAAYTTAQGTYIAVHVEGGTGVNCPGNEQGNMVVLKITQSPMAATVAWCSTQGDLGSPMVTTTDGKVNPIVWNADDHLYGWNGDTGAVIVDGTNTQMSTAVNKWNTPIDAKGRIVVGVNGQLYVFTP
jgi:hypothetical protein